MYIKKYQASNKQSVQDIFAQYWNDPEFLEELTQNLESNDTYFYTAENDDTIVGIIGLRKAPEYLCRHHTVDNYKKSLELYILASQSQNKGVGTRLLEKAIEFAKEFGYTEIVCYSPETHSDSWKFYEKNGFINQGIIHDPDDGYPGILWVNNI